MKFVWPPIVDALEKRKKTIADGLAAAEQGQKTLVDAKTEADKTLQGGKDEAKNIVVMAEKRATDIVDDAHTKASEESSKKIKAAEQEIEQMAMKLKESLKKDISGLVINGAENILKKEVDKDTHEKAIQELIKKI
tara:strand:+ start:1094 stop:1501 length:408 start_codon:yes stop_codon:yes gene_type:complete